MVSPEMICPRCPILLYVLFWDRFWEYLGFECIFQGWLSSQLRRMALIRWLSRVQNWQRCRQVLWRWWHRHWHFNTAAVYVDTVSLCEIWDGHGQAKNGQNHWVAKRVDLGFWDPFFRRMNFNVFADGPLRCVASVGRVASIGTDEV